MVEFVFSTYRGYRNDRASECGKKNAGALVFGQLSDLTKEIGLWTQEDTWLVVSGLCRRVAQ